MQRQSEGEVMISSWHVIQYRASLITSWSSHARHARERLLLAASLPIVRLWLGRLCAVLLAALLAVVGGG